MIKRIVDSQEKEEDRSVDLRPKHFSGFVGQKTMVENTLVYMTAAKKRKEPLDHMLLSGPPGLGKTTFSIIVAREMGSDVQSTTAPAIEKTGDMAAILSSLKEGEILFIDEIHRLKPIVEEMLYGAMEDNHLDINLGNSSQSRTVRIDLPPFTLIGATTKLGALTQPLLSRFGIVHRLNFYTHEDLEKIIKQNAKKLNIKISDEGKKELAKRSRGTPRLLNRLLKRVRDFAEVKGKNIIDKEMVDYALDRMKIDQLGLDEKDQRLLKVIIKNFSGGPVGIENLAASLNEDSGALEEVYEPYLIQIGFLKRTPRGRIAMPSAYRYLNIPYNDDEQPLFDHPSADFPPR